ncbi:hypothetical protein NKR23_g11001 [Pleurostoma richardsiae]|uniref:SET domain-containing protein n=1 Tax=Pleurostoma richardsiae TaxID=41990 RepID=A0AA38VDU2_9PEZI|nr:hypothetical protein NKR23_g11001 [Pleurostoma richardsiae]
MGGHQNQKTALPKNWPPEITFLTSPLYSPELTKAQIQALRVRPSASAAPVAEDLPTLPPELLRPGPNPLVRIQPITDPSHPACGQRGLFAARDLKPGMPVVRYLGEVHPAGSARHASSDYDLWLDHSAGGADVAVDAARAGSEARFVNDYRGVPGRARTNAEFRDAWDGRERCMAVYVVLGGAKGGGKGKGKGKDGGGGIAKGEEILVSYGKGFWGKRREEEEEKRRDGEGDVTDQPPE